MQVISRAKLGCFLLLLASALLALVVVVALAAGGGSPKERRLVSAHQTGAARRTYYLLTGIPQHGPELGDPAAPVTLQFFGDLQCRDSRQVMLGALPES